MSRWKLKEQFKKFKEYVQVLFLFSNPSHHKGSATEVLYKDQVLSGYLGASWGGGGGGGGGLFEATHQSSSKAPYGFGYPKTTVPLKQL